MRPSSVRLAHSNWRAVPWHFPPCDLRGMPSSRAGHGRADTTPYDQTTAPKAISVNYIRSFLAPLLTHSVAHQLSSFYQALWSVTRVSPAYVERN